LPIWNPLRGWRNIALGSSTNLYSFKREYDAESNIFLLFERRPDHSSVFTPGSPHHVIQRGNFRSDSGRRSYLDALTTISGELRVEVLGYCLMDTHSHIIVGSHSRPQSLRLAVQRLGALPARSVSAVTQGHSPVRPRPWRGRFSIHPIKDHTHLLQCLRYVDLNPVEAGIVQRPEEYEWSSYKAHIGLAPVGCLTPSPCITSLAATTGEQQMRYRIFVAQGIRA
jgi:putative transposase